MTTLDVPLRQVLVNYDDDARFRWHHRLLLVPFGDSRWIWATPDFEVQLGDLAEHNVLLLQRNASFPATVDGSLYAFDPLLPGQLERLLADGRNLGAVLGLRTDTPGDGAVGLEVWRISAPSSPFFGAEVPPAALSNPDAFLRRAEVGLAHVDGAWVACALSQNDEGIEIFKARMRAGPGRDPRLLADHVEADGRRHLPFPALYGQLTEVEFASWPIRGPRSVREFVGAVRQGGFESFNGYHSHWVRNSGVGERTGIAREHKLLCEFLRLGGEWDQFNIAASAAFELAVRRIYQVELAVKKNPKMPDFDGLEALVDTAVDSSGAVVVPTVQSWLASQQKDEAFALKQRRLWAEELAAASKKNGSASGAAGSA